MFGKCSKRFGCKRSNSNHNKTPALIYGATAGQHRGLFVITLSLSNGHIPPACNAKRPIVLAAQKGRQVERGGDWGLKKTWSRRFEKKFFWYPKGEVQRQTPICPTLDSLLTPSDRHVRRRHRSVDHHLANDHIHPAHVWNLNSRNYPFPIFW